jgi:hypothetical protein
MSQATDTPYCFYEDALPEWNIPLLMLAEDNDGDVFFPVRPIITALGVDRPTQTATIQEDSRLKPGARLIKKAPTRGGRQDTLYLRRREVAIWLTLIDPEKVGENARGRVEEFQAALWRLADKILFRRRRIAQGAATDLGEVVELHGAQHGEFTCECGRRHIIEMADGLMRVYHEQG